MKRQILVVDDEEQVRELLKVYFRKSDFEVQAVSSAAETLSALQSHKPDLIVLDIGLGEDDGLKLLGTLKADHPEIKVVMLTGMGFVEELLLEAQQKGADGYVSKVMPLDELMNEVQRVLQVEPKVAG